MVELAIKELRLQFGGLVVLDDVTFAVERQELLALTAPNGAGKTRVLNCISGIYRGRGTIDFRERDIGGLHHPHEVARLGIARRSSMASCFHR